jgi:hypothetical protein
MKLIHIAATPSYKYWLPFLFMLSVIIIRAITAEARAVVWPCTTSSELEPPVRVSRCALPPPSTWREYQRMGYPAPRSTQKSTAKLPRVVERWQRRVAWIRLVIARTTEFLSGLVESSLESNEVSRKER